MTHEGGLSAPLATLADMEAGKPLRVVGGSMVRRTGAMGAARLSDLSAMRVAVASTDSFEGYQLQAHTLQMAGVKVSNLVVTGEPQDKALQAVLDGSIEISCLIRQHSMISGLRMNRSVRSSDSLRVPSMILYPLR